MLYCTSPFQTFKQSMVMMVLYSYEFQGVGDVLSKRKLTSSWINKIVCTNSKSFALQNPNTHNGKRTHYFHFFLRISSCMQRSTQIKKTIMLQTHIHITHNFVILSHSIFYHAFVHFCQTFALRRLSFLITSIYFHVFQQFYFRLFSSICLFVLCASLRKFHSHFLVLPSWTFKWCYFCYWLATVTRSSQHEPHNRIASRICIICL